MGSESSGSRSELKVICVCACVRGCVRERRFLTMDQSRKLVLLLESDPKACSLPLVGV